MSLEVRTVPTQPIEGQATGTSGLRKETKVFMSENYLANWVQSLFTALGDPLAGSTLVLGGDGRFFNTEATQLILKIAAANGVKKMVVGQNGLLSTPAVSVLIRDLGVFGGIIMTASHNPGGPDADWGIKYNVSNGGPAPESLTGEIFENTKRISEYRVATFADVDLSSLGVRDLGGFEVEVVDSCDAYVGMMKKCFDFPVIKTLLDSGFKIVYDAMHAVTGVYAVRIFHEELGCPMESLMNIKPLPDFGGGHPDPNLTYAAELVEIMKSPAFHLGAASDGDGDRNMILGGEGVFVTPSDSVAIIAANSSCIPYFASGLKGLARSMPTGGAIDRVAKKRGVEVFEVPTGWKFFGNLMDAGRLSICGEESFGTSGDHIREKDGIWAVLAWLQILATRNAGRAAASPMENYPFSWLLTRPQNLGAASLFGMAWERRMLMQRSYDYEACDTGRVDEMFAHLEGLIADRSALTPQPPVEVTVADNFEYKDPIDGSVTKKQGIRFLFANGDRIIFRKSGTGATGATVRLYVEHPEGDAAKYQLNAQASFVTTPALNPRQEACKPLLELALQWSKLAHFTGREAPTVIT